MSIIRTMKMTKIEDKVRFLYYLSTFGRQTGVLIKTNWTLGNVI